MFDYTLKDVLKKLKNNMEDTYIYVAALRGCDDEKNLCIKYLLTCPIRGQGVPYAGFHTINSTKYFLEQNTDEKILKMLGEEKINNHYMCHIRHAAFVLKEHGFIESEWYDLMVELWYSYSTKKEREIWGKIIKYLRKTLEGKNV